MRFLSLGFVVPLALIAVACGGGERAPSPAATSTPQATADAGETATAVPTAPPQVDEAWAYQQVVPVMKTASELIRDGEWSQLYNGYSAEVKASCSRSTFVSKMIGAWVLAEAFGADELIKATLQDINDGTLRLSFSEISPTRISYVQEGEDASSPSTLVLEDGEWRDPENPCLEETQ